MRSRSRGTVGQTTPIGLADEAHGTPWPLGNLIDVLRLSDDGLDPILEEVEVGLVLATTEVIS
jgi:hypothetical protein